MRFVVPLLASLLALVGCGGSSSESPAPATHTASNGDVYNDADVEFATEMVQHHAEALAMVDLTRDRDVSPEVAALAEDVLTTQGPEVETMTGWLMDWDQEVPETVRDHANAHGHGDSGHGDESNELESAQGAEFDRLWLESMIEHHEGAVEMAREQQEEGRYEPAVELAEQIETTQTEEIDQMEQLAGS